MPSKLIFCQPETLVVSASDCNRQVDIAEVTVCDPLIGEDYNLYVNGVLDPGSPYTVDVNGKLFTGGVTIIRSFPITTLTLEFPCDDCDECDITATLPAIANPCSCAAVLMSVTLDGTDACTLGELDYTITDGEGPYQIEIKQGATVIFTDTQAVAGTYTVSDTFINGLYTLTVTDAFGCVKTTTDTIAGCCELYLNSVSYDCDLAAVVSNHFGDCVGAKSYRVKQGAATISTGVYTGANIALALANGTYTFEIWCDTCTAGPTTFSVGCGTPEFTLVQGCSGSNNTITVSGFSGGTAPYTLSYWINAGAPVDITPASDPHTVNLGSQSGNTVYVTLTNSEGNTSIPTQSLELQSCNCFSILGYEYDCDPGTLDITLRVRVSSPDANYAVDLLDSGNNVLTADIYIGALTTTFTDVYGPAALALGTYRLRVRNTSNGCSVISGNIVVEDCTEYVMDYDCATGLTVTGLTSGNYTVTKGATVYGPYAFNYSPLFVDGSNYIVKSHPAGDILGTFNIDCCNFSIDAVFDACDMLQADGQKAVLDVTVSGGDPADSYTVEVYVDGGALVGTGSIVGNTSDTITLLPENTVLDVYVHNTTYEGRAYVNGGPPNSTDCVVTVQDISAVCAEANCTDINNGMTVTADSCAGDGDITFTVAASDTGITINTINATYFRTAGCGGGTKVVNYNYADIGTTIDPTTFELLIPVGDDIEHCCDCFFYVRLAINYTYSGLSCTKYYTSAGEGTEYLCDNFGACIGTGAIIGCNF